MRRNALLKASMKEFIEKAVKIKDGKIAPETEGIEEPPVVARW